MAKIVEWEKNLEGLPVKDLARYLKALDTLREWKLFDEEFSSIRIISLMLSMAIKDRAEGKS